MPLFRGRCSTNCQKNSPEFMRDFCAVCWNKFYLDISRETKVDWLTWLRFKYWVRLRYRYQQFSLKIVLGGNVIKSESVNFIKKLDLLLHFVFLRNVLLKPTSTHGALFRRRCLTKLPEKFPWIHEAVLKQTSNSFSQIKFKETVSPWP